MAPAVLGGQDAIGWLGGPSPKRLSEKLAVLDANIHRIGEDFLITGYF